MRYFIVFILPFTLFFCYSCEKDEQSGLNNSDVFVTKAVMSDVGEFEEAYPGYEKEWVKFGDGFEFQKVIGVPDTYILNGDALINEEGILDMMRSSCETKSAVHKDPFKYWALGKVYYQYDSSATSDFITRVEAAIDDIENNCGVLFFPASSSSTNSLINFVKSTSSVGNNSYVGCIGGVQDVNIYNYTTHGVILHEILHALGIYHEHCRQDRDSYVTINWGNIRPAKQQFFYKYVSNQGYDISSLDENSVMMYKSKISDPSFVYDPSIPVMYWNGDPSRVFGGQRLALSNGDVKGLTSIYGAPFSRVSVTKTPIQHSTETVGGINYVTTIDSVRVSVRFFLERWCSTPSHLQYPRSIALIKTYVTLGGDGAIHRSTFTTNIYPTPGTSNYPVDNYIYRKVTANGQIVDYYDIEYSVR